MQNSVFARGGKATTRSQLVLNRTADLVQQFLNEANVTLSPINYRYMSIWDLLKIRYGNDADSYRRAINLASYYSGFLNFSCNQVFDGTTLLQRFALIDESVYLYPVYACTRPVMGCESSNDCHIEASCFWACCYCYGNSCIDDAQNGRAIVKRSKSGGIWDGPNASCYYKVGVTCGCSTEGTQWENIWISRDYIKPNDMEILSLN